jgi:hypothetical protein
MNQSINIFRKDAAHLLPQLSLPIFTLTLFTVLESKSWVAGPLTFFSTPALTNVLAALFFMAWAILIVSLVQAERLVGLNQFWTTRPYEWHRLIAAKCLSLLAFLYLPLIVSQMIILHQAHLPMLQSIPELLHNLLLLTAIFVLPVACAAALTRSIVQAVMALLVCLAMVVALVFFATSKDLTPRMLMPLLIVLIAAVLMVAIANQYRRRTTDRSLCLLAAAPVLVALLLVSVPGRSLGAFEYHPPAGAPPVSVQFDSNPLRAFGNPANVIRNPPDAARSHASDLVADPGKDLLLHIPLLVSAVDPEATFALDGHRITLTGADGTAWQSPWLAEVGMLAPPSTAAPFPASADFSIPRSVYARLGDGPISIRIDFALTQLQNQAPIRTTLSTSGEMIPSLGFCSLDESYETIVCRSAFRNPPRFAVATSRKIGPCTAQDAQVDPALGAIGDAEPSSLLPHVTAVDTVPVQLSFTNKAAYLCPGTPITYTEKRVRAHIEVQMPAATVRLSDYVASVRPR